MSLYGIVVGHPLFFGELPNSHNDNVTLDLNGQSLTLAGGIFMEGGNLTVQNGKLTGSSGVQLVLGGYDNDTTLTVTDGATLSMSGGGVFLSDNATNAFILDGPGTTASLVDSFIDVRQGSSFHVQNGAVLNSSRKNVIINDPEINGEAVVDGPGSKWTIGGGQTLYIGATGSLTIANEGIVHGNRTALVKPSGKIDIGFASLLKSPVNNRGELHVDGTIDGFVDSYGLITGQGQLTGTLNLQAGSSIAPGNSVGEVSMSILGWYSGSTFRLEINSATGSAGGANGWDRLVVSKFAAIGLGSANAKMVIALQTLNDQDLPGMLSDFDPTQNYHWTFLTAETDIFNFASDSFVVDTSGFANPIMGQFNVSQVNNSLVLNYVIPEPSTGIMAAIGCCLLCVLRKRFKKS
jgi:T5SS/PEP-CTERM-associated repeat protein